MALKYYNYPLRKRSDIINYILRTTSVQFSNKYHPFCLFVKAPATDITIPNLIKRYREVAEFKPLPDNDWLAKAKQLHDTLDWRELYHNSIEKTRTLFVSCDEYKTLLDGTVANVEYSLEGRNHNWLSINKLDDSVFPHTAERQTLMNMMEKMEYKSLRNFYILVATLKEKLQQMHIKAIIERNMAVVFVEQFKHALSLCSKTAVR